MYDLVKRMHRYFKINNTTGPTALSAEEYKFRIRAMLEEVFEYISAVVPAADNETFQDIETRLYATLESCMITPTHNTHVLEAQFDALIDLAIFTMGTSERHGFNFPVGFKRVMEKNMQKKLAGTYNSSKRGFSADLIKPDGWTPPDLLDLVKPAYAGRKSLCAPYLNNLTRGLVVIDGPDASGKTTLAEYLREQFGGVIIHHTWNTFLEENMYEYLMGGLVNAINESKNQLVIIDRLWLSEFIYSATYRTESSISAFHGRAYRMLRDAGAVNVIALIHDAKQAKQLFSKMENTRGEMYCFNPDLHEWYSLFWHATDSKLPNKLSPANVSVYRRLNNLHLDEQYLAYDLTKTSCDSMASRVAERLLYQQGKRI